MSNDCDNGQLFAIYIQLFTDTTVVLPFLQLDLPPNVQDNIEDQDDGDLDDSTESFNDLQTTLSTPCTPTPTSCTSSPVECLDSPSIASTNSVESSTRGIKRKSRSVPDVELQKLAVLKQMAAKVEADPTPDAFTTFGNQVASELRLLQDAANVTRLKRNIMNMIYDAQDAERNISSSSHSHSPTAPYTFHPILTHLPSVQSYPQHMPPEGSRPQGFLQRLPHYDVSESF